MPQNNSEKNGVSLKNLEEYYDSLEELVNNYENTHEVSGDKKGEYSEKCIKP